MPTRPALRRCALVALVALGLTGCVAPKHQASSPTAGASSSATSDPALARYYDQVLEWTTCGDEQCADATVPLDWEDPGGDTITIALRRAPASGGSPVGSLLVNPGGPGRSAIDTIGFFRQIVSRDVLATYDLVAFDPRGVQHSSPVTCVDPAGLDELTAWVPDWSTDEGIAEAVDRNGEFGRACLDRTGPLLGHVDTASAARDMDVLRAALGDEALTFLGFSYGTELGATYAALFPERVGRFVLDGALDPTLDSGQVAAGQAAGFESALRAYVTDCQAAASCPLDGDVDAGLTQIARMFDRVRANPLPTGTDRELTSSLAFSGVAAALYAQSSWPLLTQALTKAIDAGDGSVLLQLADSYYGRGPDGTYATNQNEAFSAILCLDDRPSADPADMRADAAEVAAVAPTVGQFFSYGGVSCAQWPVPAVGSLESYEAQGAAPILVVGTTNDPATPYAWAQSLSKLLSSAVLLTFEGEGHTAYGRSNACVKDAVDTYLLTGEAPADGTTC
ncbi:alpha/beta hydrolase [Cellulomonas dongxiuzhuiae]|uniref:alpha/beta hydrolase n=1 Tax=Cellulomonas dongxiuzhuiae TaxID=2819979 RepID=UPI001AAF75A3|nr:alpha/beta hydrolase [Cellulomonas dongxiuzhuiae]MBO3089911.1 alpha/beta fold hydrolase [Cellulomonas dongxiuzhuiae]